MAKRNKRKSTLPKRVAGLKIPKNIRKGGLEALLTSPIGAGVVSNLLTAGAAAFAGHEMHGDSKTRRATRAAGHDLHQTGAAVTASASALTFALGEAARTFVETLKAQRDRSPDTPPSFEADERPEPPSPPRRQGTKFPQQGPAAH